MTCAYIWLSIYWKRILLFIVIDALDFANCRSPRPRNSRANRVGTGLAGEIGP
jgi:hypothetical protein